MPDPKPTNPSPSARAFRVLAEYLPSGRFLENSAEAVAERAHRAIESHVTGTTPEPAANAQFELLLGQARKARGLPAKPERVIHAERAARADLAERGGTTSGDLGLAAESGLTAGGLLPLVGLVNDEAAMDLSARTRMMAAKAAKTSPVLAPVASTAAQVVPLIGGGIAARMALAPSLLTPAVALGAGAQVFEPEYQALLAAGIPEERARAEARDKALVTGAVTLATGLTGAERAIAGPAVAKKVAAESRPLVDTARRIVGQGAQESGQEVAEELANIEIESRYGRTEDLAGAMKRVGEAGALGFAVGAPMAAPSEIAQGLSDRAPAAPSPQAAEQKARLQAEATARRDAEKARVEEEQRARILHAQTREAEAKAKLAEAQAAAAPQLPVQPAAPAPAAPAKKTRGKKPAAAAAPAPAPAQPVATAPAAPVPATDEGTTFTTERGGSVYTVGASGTTSRVKGVSGGVHQGDSGQKEASTRTVYVTPDVANALGVIYAGGLEKSADFSLNPDGGITLTSYAGRNPDGTLKAHVVVYPSSPSPMVGLHPVEVMATSKHVGSKITNITRPSAKTGAAASIDSLLSSAAFAVPTTTAANDPAVAQADAALAAAAVPEPAPAPPATAVAEPEDDPGFTTAYPEVKDPRKAPEPTQVTLPIEAEIDSVLHRLRNVQNENDLVSLRDEITELAARVVRRQAARPDTVPPRLFDKVTDGMKLAASVSRAYSLASGPIKSTQTPAPGPVAGTVQRPQSPMTAREAASMREQEIEAGSPENFPVGTTAVSRLSSTQQESVRRGFADRGVPQPSPRGISIFNRLRNLSQRRPRPTKPAPVEVAETGKTKAEREAETRGDDVARRASLPKLSTKQRENAVKELGEVRVKVTNIEKNKLAGPKVLKLLTDTKELRAKLDAFNDPDLSDQARELTSRIEATMPDLADVQTTDDDGNEYSDDPGDIAAAEIIERELDRHRIPREREVENHETGEKRVVPVPWTERIAQLAAEYETRMASPEGLEDVKRQFASIQEAKIQAAQQHLAAPQTITDMLENVERLLGESESAALDYVQTVLSIQGGVSPLAQQLQAESDAAADTVTVETVRKTVLAESMNVKIGAKGARRKVRVYAVPTGITSLVEEYKKLFLKWGSEAKQILAHREASEATAMLQARIDNLNERATWAKSRLEILAAPHKDDTAEQIAQRKAFVPGLEQTLADSTRELAKAKSDQAKAAKTAKKTAVREADPDPRNPEIQRLVEIGYVLRLQQIHGLRATMKTALEHAPASERKAILHQYVNEMTRIVNGVQSLDVLASPNSLPDPSSLKGWTAEVQIAEDLDAEGNPTGVFTAVRASRKNGKVTSVAPVNAGGATITPKMRSDAERYAKDDLRLGRLQGDQSKALAIAEDAQPFTSNDPADIMRLIYDAALYIPDVGSVRVELQNALSGTMPSGKLSDTEKIGFGLSREPSFRGARQKIDLPTGKLTEVTHTPAGTDTVVFYDYPDLWVEGADSAAPQGAPLSVQWHYVDQWVQRHLITQNNEARAHPKGPNKFHEYNDYPTVAVAPVQVVHRILREKFGITEPEAFMDAYVRSGMVLRSHKNHKTAKSVPVYKNGMAAHKYRTQKNVQSLLTSKSFAGPNPAATALSVDRATRSIGDLFGIPLSMGATEGFTMDPNAEGEYFQATGEVQLSHANVKNILHEAGHKMYDLGVARELSTEEKGDLLRIAHQSKQTPTYAEGFSELFAQIGENLNDPVALAKLQSDWPHAWNALHTSISGPYAAARDLAWDIARQYYSPTNKQGTGFVSPEDAKAREDARTTKSVFIDGKKWGWVPGPVAGAVTRAGRALFDPNIGMGQIVNSILKMTNRTRSDISAEQDPILLSDEARNFGPKAAVALERGFEIGGPGGQVRGSMNDVIESLDLHGFTHGPGRKRFAELSKMLSDLDSSPRLRRKLGINDSGPFAWTTSVDEITDPFNSLEELKAHNAEAATFNDTPAGNAAPRPIYEENSYGRNRKQDHFLDVDSAAEAKKLFDQLNTPGDEQTAFTAAYERWQEHLQAFDAWRNSEGDLSDTKAERRSLTQHFSPARRESEGSVEVSATGSTQDVIDPLEMQIDAVVRAFARIGHTKKVASVVHLYSAMVTGQKAQAEAAKASGNPDDMPIIDPRIAKLITPQSFQLEKDAKSLEAFERGDSHKDVEVTHLRLDQELAQRLVDAGVFAAERGAKETDAALAERLMGEVVRFRATDPILREWIRRDVPSLGDLKKTANLLLTPFRGLASGFRAGWTTYNPEYWLKGGIWDFWTVMVTDPEKTPIKWVTAPLNMVKTMYKLMGVVTGSRKITDDPILKAAERAGILVLDAHTPSFAEPIARTEVQASDLWAKALGKRGYKHVIGNAHRFFSRLPLAIFNAPRVSAFERSLRMNMKQHGIHSVADLDKIPMADRKAMLAAAAATANEATMNGLRMGKAIAVANPYVPFLNSSIQGSITIGKALAGYSPHDRKFDKTRMITNIAGAVIAPTVAAMALLLDEDDETIDEYFKRPLSERLRYHVIPGVGKFPKVPGFVGVMQTYLEEIILQTAKQNAETRDTVKHSLWEVAKSTLPMLPDYWQALYSVVLPGDELRPGFAADIDALPLVDRPRPVQWVANMGLPEGVTNRITAAMRSYTGGGLRWMLDDIPLRMSEDNAKATQDSWRTAPMIRLFNLADPGLYDSLGQRFMQYSNLDLDANIKAIEGSYERGQIDAAGAEKAKTRMVHVYNILEGEKRDLTSRFFQIGRQLQAIDRDKRLTVPERLARMDTAVDIMHIEIDAWMRRADTLMKDTK